MTMLLDVTLALEWESATPAGPVKHRDCLFAGGMDPNRDALPGDLMARISLADIGEPIEQSIAMWGEDEGGAIFAVPVDAVRNPHALGASGRLRKGLFYSSTLFTLPPERQTRWTIPVRYLGTDNGVMTLDTRHPLADHEPRLSATVLRIFDGNSGDRPSIDWGHRLASGPGMQACWRGTATDFVFDGAYARADESEDGKFYDMPRITAHIDINAQETVGDYYARVIPPDGRVLDLMSSTYSNLHRRQQFGALVGLGMNAAEMAVNDRLSQTVVADLNAGGNLPFADKSFDAALCTVSIDYLTDPARVVRDVGRVLRPGAGFAVTYSNRWFPTKVTQLWTELTSFEQTGLVASYFMQSGLFEGIETASFRGLPRPPHDPYAGQAAESDPVFAVTGFARS